MITKSGFCYIDSLNQAFTVYIEKMLDSEVYVYNNSEMTVLYATPFWCQCWIKCCQLYCTYKHHEPTTEVYQSRCGGSHTGTLIPTTPLGRDTPNTVCVTQWSSAFCTPWPASAILTLWTLLVHIQCATLKTTALTLWTLLVHIQSATQSPHVGQHYSVAQHVPLRDTINYSSLKTCVKWITVSSWAKIYHKKSYNILSKPCDGV